MWKKREGKVAVIAGGSSGRRPETAKLFVEEGTSINITGRRQDVQDVATSCKIWNETCKALITTSSMI